MLKIKSKEDVEKDISKKINSLNYPILFSVISFINLAILFKTGCSKLSTPVFDPISWSKFASYLPLMIIFSSVVFFGTVLYQKSTKKLPFEKITYICMKCENVYEKVSAKTCDCSGELVNLDEVEFVED